MHKYKCVVHQHEKVFLNPPDDDDPLFPMNEKKRKQDDPKTQDPKKPKRMDFIKNILLQSR